MLLKKNIKKILFVLVAVIIAFSCCCIPASAQTVGTEVKSFSDFCDLDYVQFSYLRDGLWDSSEPITSTDWVNMTDFYDSELVGNSLFVSCSGDTGWGAWQRFKVRVQFKIKRAFQIEGFYSGSFLITLLNGLENDFVFGQNSRLPDSILLFTGEGSQFHYGQLNYNNHMKYTALLTQNSSADTFDTFVVEFYIMNQRRLLSDYVYEFNFSNLNFDIVTKDEKTINAIIQSNNENADKIMQNQNDNADKIIQNQEQNQEEIKNGWQQETEIDSSTTDDYAAKDKELQEATEQGRSEAVSVFNSFGSLFQSDGHLYKGLLSVSAMFTEFMKIDWLSSLLNFSLAIGIFAFVIGTGSQIFKSAHERYKDDKISKIDNYDERWLM